MKQYTKLNVKLNTECRLWCNSINCLSHTPNATQMSVPKRVWTSDFQITGL